MSFSKKNFFIVTLGTIATVLAALALKEPLTLRWYLYTLNSGDDADRRFAAGRLDEIGSRAVPGLIEALRHENERVRGFACVALGRIGPTGGTAVLEALAVALKDKHENVRFDAASVLRAFGPPAAGPLAEAVRSDDWEAVRWTAAHSLGQIGPAVGNEAVRALRLATRDQNRSVRHFSAIALAEILRSGAADVSPILEEALRDEDLRPAATEALKRVHEKAQ